jgi:4-amino-4-deoxy-L-arabinose transferase-like glycosyltransferase
MLAKRGFRLLLVATAVVYFYGLGRAPLVGADEPRYAEVAREMFARGDLVTPTLGGRPWFEKPALGYWAAMAGFKLFGVSEWSARLGAALAGWLTVLLVGWMCGRIETRTGFGANAEMSGDGIGHDEISHGGISDGGISHDEISDDEINDEISDDEGARWLRLACACVVASSAGLVAFSHAVNFDIFLTATVTLSLACFFVSETEGEARRRRLLLAGFYAGTGCALLAKGLVGAVIAFGVVGLYQVLRRRVPRAWKSMLWGVPLMLLVAACWYAPVTYAHGRAFLTEFFVKHHFARFVSDKYHHSQPLYFYLLVLPSLALPWTPFFLAALKNIWHTTRRRRNTTNDDATISNATTRNATTRDAMIDRAPISVATRGAATDDNATNDNVADDNATSDNVARLRLFALAWTIVPVAFFSISQSKLPGYILPALPGAAVLAGCGLWRYARGVGGSWAMRATGCVLLAGAAGVLIYSSRTGLVAMNCALLVAAPLALGGVWAMVARGSRARVACAVVGSSLLTTMLLAGCAQEGLARRESVRDLLALAAARGYATAPVLNLYTVERSTEFYGAGRVVYDERGEPKMFDGVYPVEEFARARGEAVLVVVPVEFANQLTRSSRGSAELIGDNGVNALVVVR